MWISGLYPGCQDIPCSTSLHAGDSFFKTAITKSVAHRSVGRGNGYPPQRLPSQGVRGGPRAAEEAGIRLAVLTSLVRLLENKAFELEGPGGTGTLEDDIALLEASAASGVPVS